MRTAITIVRRGKKWSLLYGPDVPPLQQRQVATIVANWPEGVDELHFQWKDRPALCLSRERAEALHRSFNEATKRSEEKAAIAKKRDDAAHAAHRKEQADRQKLRDEAEQKAWDEKEQRKKELQKAFSTPPPTKSSQENE